MLFLLLFLHAENMYMVQGDYSLICAKRRLDLLKKMVLDVANWI